MTTRMFQMRSSVPLPTGLDGYVVGVAHATGSGATVVVPNTIDDLQVGDQLVVFVASRECTNLGGPVTATGWSGGFSTQIDLSATALFAVGRKASADAGDVAAASWTFSPPSGDGNHQACVVALRGVDSMLDFSRINFNGTLAMPRYGQTSFVQPPIGTLLGPNTDPRGAFVVSMSLGPSPVKSVSPPATPQYDVLFYEAIAGANGGSMIIAEVLYDDTQVSTTNVAIGHDLVVEDGVTATDSAVVTFAYSPS